jgi:serine/threonine-protein kinase
LRAATLVGGAVVAAAVLMVVVLSGPSSSAPAPATPRAAESLGLPAVQNGAAAEDVEPAGKTFRSVGGAVAASCANGKVRLGSWVAAAGFVVRKVNPGPSREARVEFGAGEVRVNVTVHCTDGTPVARITD